MNKIGQLKYRILYLAVASAPASYFIVNWPYWRQCSRHPFSRSVGACTDLDHLLHFSLLWISIRDVVESREANSVCYATCRWELGSISLMKLRPNVTRMSSFSSWLTLIVLVSASGVYSTCLIWTTVLSASIEIWPILAVEMHRSL